MHEMALAQGLVGIITDEMAKHGLTKLHEVTIKHGVLSQVFPEALETSFEIMTHGGPLEGARLVMVAIPMTLACSACGLEFAPGDANFLSPCPSCGEEIAHRVLTGKEFFIESIEAE